MRVGSQTPLKAFRQADFPKNLQVVGVATRSDCFSAPVAIATAAATNSATCRTTVLSSKINEEGDLHPEIIIMPLVKQTNTAWLGGIITQNG